MCQSVRQGAVNPTSYNSMNDNSGLTPDHLYKLTNKLLCQLYYNNRAQYAHKRAFLVGTGSCVIQRFNKTQEDLGR